MEFLRSNARLDFSSNRGRLFFLINTQYTKNSNFHTFQVEINPLKWRCSCGHQYSSLNEEDKFQRHVKWKVMYSDMMHCFIHSLCLYSIFITRHNKWNLTEIFTLCLLMMKLRSPPVEKHFVIQHCFNFCK